MADLHWNFRNHLRELCEAQRLPVFMCLYLHKNIRSRAFPTYQTVHKETGLSSKTISDAYKWLSDHLMIAKVPWALRTKDEKRDTKPSQNVWQLTGVMKFGDEIQPYLHLNPEGWAGMLHELEQVFSSLPSKELILYSVNSLASKDKVVKKKDSEVTKDLSSKTPLPPKPERYSNLPPVHGEPKPSVNQSLIDEVINQYHAMNIKHGKDPVGSKVRREMTLRPDAKDIVLLGYTAKDVAAFMEAKYKEPFWRSTRMTMHYILDQIHAWRAANPERNPMVAAHKADLNTFKVTPMEPPTENDTAEFDLDKTIGDRFHYKPPVENWRKRPTPPKGKSLTDQ